MNIEIDAYGYGNIDAYKEEYVHTSREIDTDYGNTDAYEYGNIHVYEQGYVHMSREMNADSMQYHANMYTHEQGDRWNL